MATMREKWRAYRKVARALDDGRLVRPATCSRCHKKVRAIAGVAQIQAHHWHGYSAAHQLDIVWLCASCNNLARAAHDAREAGVKPSAAAAATMSMVDRLKAAKLKREGK